MMAGQLDAVLVNRSLTAHVTDASVYRYRNEQGKELPLPNTYNQRKKNPSDHFPVLMHFNLSDFSQTPTNLPTAPSQNSRR